jgi:hypothetical protein
MSKGFGIAALVFAIIGIFIPFGYFLSGLSGFFAIFTYKNGFPFGLSSILINIINILFLSPTLIIAAVGASNKNDDGVGNVIFVLILLQIIPLIVFLVSYIKNKFSK